jgi:glycosyltransferase involved in cell wall biosynthesis
MRHASLTLARELKQVLKKLNGEPSVIFASSMLNLTELQGLCPEIRLLKKVVYFHENQLNYPLKPRDKRDEQYVFSEFLGSQVADEIWYNSDFHLQLHHGSLRTWLKKMPAPSLLPEFEQWRHNASVMYPGFTLEQQATLCQTRFTEGHLSTPEPCAKKVRLLWAARWDDDKQPHLLLDVIDQLKQEQISFELVILGGAPQDDSEDWTRLRNLGDQLLHCGYLQSRTDYFKWMSSCDIILSTAHHEFFGISVMEAMSMGLKACLPRALAYPELYGDLPDSICQWHDYQTNQIISCLKNLMLSDPEQTERQAQLNLSRCHQWQEYAPQADEKLVKGAPRIDE